MAASADLTQQFRHAFESADVSVDEVWLRFFGLGGEADRCELDAYLNGAITLPPIEHDILAHAINERLDEIAPPRAPYSADFQRVNVAGDGEEEDS
ncbi:MAG: hypothetical protein QOG47_1151 [Mycobacterium sp.]|nr:hypothetical protein [Mycobacterium sp.]